ncbi:MAG: hypothetical protein VYA84_15860 [Planctomycetota bacterium]|nr:hypothetical protein [Planctomycetota bacterium]
MSQPHTHRYCFKQVDTKAEQEQVNRLLYRTFVLEIPRYEDPGQVSLVDRFHERNTYFIAVFKQQVCGIIAVHGGPEFSIAKALDDPHKLKELKGTCLEARIFAVEPSHRFGIVFGGLANQVFKYATANHISHILITGLATKHAMYERMGFHALGQSTLRGGDYFVPMTMDVDRAPAKILQDIERFSRR